ncbi:MoaD/ThiS family protein [Stenoxybacter acetivorans]|uniref:MoaD/ThiS family protein n=1 Tax=Stenoxybacter acetivorans TaxID=422441 RepID=UPI0005635B7A|nr:MoaD/ThiS family protein [Stenoxybacter acetivorans]
MITIHYLAKLADLVGIAEEQIDWAGGSSDDLVAYLRARDETWNTALSPANLYKIALNNTIIYAAKPIADGDVVALLPPVTGG